MQTTAVVPCLALLETVRLADQTHVAAEGSHQAVLKSWIVARLMTGACLALDMDRALQEPSIEFALDSLHELRGVTEVYQKLEV